MIAALTLTLTLAAYAADANAPHDHQGAVPAYTGAPPAVPLAADELAQLAAGEMVLKQARAGNGGHAVAFMEIQASADTIWSRILNYKMYPTWVDNVSLCEVYRKDGANFYTRFILDPIGMKIEYFVKHVYRPDQGYLTWTLDYARQSDLDDSVGYWRVTPITTDPMRTRLEYSVDVRFKGWIPQFAQDMIAKQGLTTAVSWVRKQSEGG